MNECYCHSVGPNCVPAARRPIPPHRKQSLRFGERAALAADGISLARLLGGHLEEREGEEGLQGESNFGGKTPLISSVQCRTEMQQFS